MTEIPKELTPQLLGLVFGEEVYKIEEDIHAYCEIAYQSQNTLLPNYKYENIDTLTRLMKEWCINNLEFPSIDIHYNQINITIFIRHHSEGLLFNATTDTEFEAVLKCTHYVMKEKGLI